MGAAPRMAEAGLKRRLGPGLLTAYGVGVMVGAGIYVLVGAVAGRAGIYAPLSFLLAGLAATPTALSYAELSARIPVASGEAAYVAQGLGRRGLALFVGLAIVLAGSISAAAVLRGGVGYLSGLVSLPGAWAVIVLGGALTLVALIGVLESLALAALFTLVEVGGLLMVVWAGFTAPVVVDFTALPPPGWAGIGAASVLAFFAFIGFEDIVNMAEEARDPGRTMPRVILGALAITALLYALVSLAALRAVTPEALAASERPLALVWEAATGRAAGFLSAIAVVAALNGVLAQIVMASRVLFGLGRRSRALAVFAHAHPRLGTPVLATLLVGVAVVGGALTLPVALLAEYTTLVLLVVFVLVNGALIGLKRQGGEVPFRVPGFVPWLGILTSVAMFAANFLEGS